MLRPSPRIWNEPKALGSSGSHLTVRVKMLTVWFSMRVAKFGQMMGVIVGLRYAWWVEEPTVNGMHTQFAELNRRSMVICFEAWFTWDTARISEIPRRPILT